jgi:Glycosyl transferase family 2
VSAPAVATSPLARAHYGDMPAMTETTNADLHFVMMQRDDVSLARWLDHYATITPPDHLIIVDNGSTDTATLERLHQAELDGVRVIRDFGTQEHFRCKGELLASIIDSLPSDDATFAVPVDCDEFLAVFTPHGLSIAPADILAEFDRLLSFNGTFRIEYSLHNVPEAPHWYYPKHYQKGFTKAGQIQSLDHGHHNPTSIRDTRVELTRFVYLHHHNPGWAEWWRLARLKFLHKWDIDVPEQREALLAAWPLAGRHMLEQIRDGEGAYLSKYSGEFQIQWNPECPGLIRLREPETAPTIWNGAAYLRSNSDVAAHYTLGALYHYIAHGRREGRRLRSLPVGAAA